MPGTKAELRGVSGFGEIKAAKYGEENLAGSVFCNLISDQYKRKDKPEWIDMPAYFFVHRGKL